MRRIRTIVLAAALASALTTAPAAVPGLVDGIVGSYLGSQASAQGPKPKAAADDLEFEPASAQATPPSKTLERAVKLYEKKDYFSASIELQKVLNGESGDDARNKQRGEFFMGKTLYYLGFYAGSLAYFDRIVQAGQAHTYHAATLKWLAALSRVLPETSGILEKIGGYDPAALEDPIMSGMRDELYFLLGRHFYRRGADGDLEKAVQLFQKVSRDSEFFIRSKFFEGVTFVRRLEGKPAVEAFKEILVIGEEKPKQYKPEEIRRYTELANLQMARVFYSTQQFDTSIRYFEKLEQQSRDWTKSLFEASWAYFMKDNNSKALGNIHTLNAPYFEDEFYPESVLLRAVIYFNYCQYDRALEAVNDYEVKYKPLVANLEQLMTKYEDNAEFYEYVKKLIAGKGEAADETERLVLSALSDQSLRKDFDWVDELQRELDALSKTDKAWQTTQVASDVNQELTVQRSLADSTAGREARNRVAALAKELRRLRRDGSKIKIEILRGMAEKVADQELRRQTVQASREEPIIIDDEHFMWKFNGEYWKDELGYYRFKIRNNCPKK